MINKQIENVERATPSTVILRFRWGEQVQPGQFIMVWIPGTGEIPISLSHLGDLKGITVKAYGSASTALTEMKKGDRLFFRGPYGNSFRISKGPSLIVGGGSGMAGLLPLIDNSAYGVVSAKTSEELLFVDRFSQGNVRVVTDDGSAGIKGFAVDGLKTLDLSNFSTMYVCGPELMLKSVLDYVRDKEIDVQFSLERMMKCGIGVYDSCSIDGYQLCRDGPVFGKSLLSSMEEFGKYRLSDSGFRLKL